MKNLCCHLAMFATLGSIMNDSNSTINAVQKDSLNITTSQGKRQPHLFFSTLWADDDGNTHISNCRLEGLEFKSYAPPAAPQWIGVSPDEIESIAYAALPVGYVGTWHPAPGPQWVITLSGQWSVETTDGTVLTQGPGEMQFNDDSKAFSRVDDKRVGHLTRTVGNIPNLQLIIKLKDNPNKKIKLRNCL